MSLISNMAPVPLITKINNALNKGGKYLNYLNIITGLFIGLAYIYLSFPSILGLVFGIIMTLGSSAVMSINYYFTSKNTLHPENQKNISPKKSLLSPSAKARLFLSIAIPCIIINAIANFIGTYMGVLLLSGALALPFAPPVVIAIAVIAASLLAVGVLLNSWLQTHNIWEGIKKANEPSPIVSTTAQYKKGLTQIVANEYKEESSQTDELTNNDSPSPEKTTQITNTPLPEAKHPYPFFESPSQRKNNEIPALPQKNAAPKPIPAWSSSK